MLEVSLAILEPTQVVVARSPEGRAVEVASISYEQAVAI